jgi:hypothetical protein
MFLYATPFFLCVSACFSSSAVTFKKVIATLFHSLTFPPPDTSDFSPAGFLDGVCLLTLLLHPAPMLISVMFSFHMLDKEYFWAETLEEALFLILSKKLTFGTPLYYEFGRVSFYYEM